MATLNGKTPQAMAKAIIDESNAVSSQHDAKVKAIAAKLQIEYAKAYKLVEQEEKRKAAGERYRKSDSYRRMLEQQKIVRAMLKG